MASAASIRDQPMQKVQAGKLGTHHRNVNLLRLTAARRF
jgi:hypothetical protein